MQQLPLGPLVARQRLSRLEVILLDPFECNLSFALARLELNILPIAFRVFSGDFDGGLRIADELDARLAAANDRAIERFKAKLAVVRCAIACFASRPRKKPSSR